MNKEIGIIRKWESDTIDNTVQWQIIYRPEWKNKHCLKNMMGK